ncbi:hypothetical protein [Anderseniella sp. Alg231-50]|uniref:hypothetical protein n=1 Tax=Anderseniella sp. Alg231-50 TaxID=1922226 RepID=UPI000D55F6F0
MTQQSTAAAVFSRVLIPPEEETTASGSGRFVRLALATAMLSVCLESVISLPGDWNSINTSELVASVGLLVTVPAVFFIQISRLAIAAFTVFLTLHVLNDWDTLANHTWLAAWTIPAAAFVSKWWERETYADYLRITLGIVMLAAAGQKLLAGTYLDGSFIAYLSYSGSTTEQMFQFFCSEQTLQNPCGWHKFLGTFIVAWQVVVGLLLLAGLRSLWFLFIEVGFLLGAGVYADEMNFQVLNIALLCVAFRVGMSYWLFAICAVLLVVDVFGIGRLLVHAF